jgi:hypothetical protein
MHIHVVRTGMSKMNKNTVEIKADNLCFYIEKKYVKILEKIQNICYVCELSTLEERQKKYATAILTLVQYFCGMHDVIHSITIKAENDAGKKYTIKITQ